MYCVWPYNSPGGSFFPRIFDPAVKQAGSFIRTQKRSQVMYDKHTCTLYETLITHQWGGQLDITEFKRFVRGHLTTLESSYLKFILWKNWKTLESCGSIFRVARILLISSVIVEMAQQVGVILVEMAQQVGWLSHPKSFLISDTWLCGDPWLIDAAIWLPGVNSRPSYHLIPGHYLPM